MAQADLIYGIGGAVLLVLILGLGLWALRFQSRQFPKGTKLKASDKGAPGWLATKFTWLSGGHG